MISLKFPAREDEEAGMSVSSLVRRVATSRTLRSLVIGAGLVVGVGTGAVVEALDHDPPAVYILHRHDSTGAPRVTCDPDTWRCTDGSVSGDR